MNMDIDEYRKKFQKKKSGNKFSAKKTEYGGITYDSKKEAWRARELDLLIRAKEVLEVEVQPVFDCIINGKKTFKYKADFKITWADGTITYEDVKGYKKGSAYSHFRTKKKVVEALFGVEILEV